MTKRTHPRMIKIANQPIGLDYPPFIVAEMSANHNQSLEQALRIAEEAARCGAHAIKIQTYTADTMTIDVKKREFFISDQKSLWNGKGLYELYKEAYTPWEWHKAIFDRCRELGISGFSTPFDTSAVDFLETLNVPCYKIASFENTDLSLIEKVAATGKPVIISTGMATIAELDETVRTVRKAGCKELILLKCTSSYPATPEDINLKTIQHLRDLFQCEVGLSDHTMGFGVPIASVALGSTLIEKHFTLNRLNGGVDSAFSIEPEEMKILVIETERAWRALGNICYGPIGEEKKSLRFRRSIYIVRDMKAGDIFTEENLRVIRPGFGLPPKYFDAILGKRVVKNVKRGTPFTWDLLG